MVLDVALQNSVSPESIRIEANIVIEPYLFYLKRQLKLPLTYKKNYITAYDKGPYAWRIRICQIITLFANFSYYLANKYANLQPIMHFICSFERNLCLVFCWKYKLRARLNGKIVCRFFNDFLMIFQWFFNQNGANSLASLCEKNDFSKIVNRSFGFGV